MILAHSSLAAHGLTFAIAGVASVGYYLLWARRPTPTTAPVVWWCGGILVVVLASLPVVERIAERTFTGHMVQHLALWVLAPPLFVAARPMRVALRAGVLPFRHFSISVPARMAAAWAAIVVTLYGSHLTSIYDRALGNQLVHELEHGAYLAASVLLWATILGPGRAAAPARVGLALGTMAAMVILGMVLTSGDTVLYDTYLARMGPADALADQHRGGALMWVGSMLSIVPLIVLSVWRWAARDHEITVQLEQAASSEQIL